MRFELIHLSEHTHPDYIAPIYLVQFAVNGQVAPPIWASKRDRVEMGDERWLESLRTESFAALRDQGIAKALRN